MRMSKSILFSSFIFAALLTTQTDVFARMGEHQGHHGESTADKSPEKQFTADKSPEKDTALNQKGPKKQFTTDEAAAE